MLYQLSYFRIVTLRANGFPDCECKGNAFSETSKTLGYFFSRKTIRMFPYAPSHGYTPRTISGIPAPTKQDELYTAPYKYFR